MPSWPQLRCLRFSGWSFLTPILLGFLALAAASALTHRPWCDEAWFASAAFNLVRHSSMSTSVLDPTSTWRSVQLTGIDRYTYWIMPFYILLQSAWCSASA